MKGISHYSHLVLYLPEVSPPIINYFTLYLAITTSKSFNKSLSRQFGGSSFPMWGPTLTHLSRDCMADQKEAASQQASNCQQLVRPCADSYACTSNTRETKYNMISMELNRIEAKCKSADLYNTTQPEPGRAKESREEEVEEGASLHTTKNLTGVFASSQVFSSLGGHQR